MFAFRTDVAYLVEMCEAAGRVGRGEPHRQLGTIGEQARAQAKKEEQRKRKADYEREWHKRKRESDKPREPLSDEERKRKSEQWREWNRKRQESIHGPIDPDNAFVRTRLGKTEVVRGRSARSKRWVIALSPLIEHPGQWARVYECEHANAGPRAYALKNNRVEVPPGRWEFTSAKKPDDPERGYVFAKYLGPE